MNTTNILLKISKQGQLTLPVWLKEFGFERDLEVHAEIDDRGNLVITKPSDPIEELKGMFKDAKINPAFKGLNDKESIRLARKMEYENKD